MNETLVKLTAECVAKNTTFSGQVGTYYTVQDLFHNVSTKSINNIWKRTKKELDSLKKKFILLTIEQSATKNIKNTKGKKSKK